MFSEGFNEMRMASKVTMFLTIAGCLALPVQSAQAQYSIQGEQPPMGELHVKESRLSKQLTKDYQLGLIDPFELSNMTRDLDAIRCREEAFRMRKQGMTPKAMTKIAKDLDSFQADLNRRCNERQSYTVAQQ